jgi:glycosyltransferase involved in cell wall biosynthesis
VQRPAIVYVQFTNPADYPPLQHSSRILAEDGWDVLFLGTESFGAANLQLERHERIYCEQLPYSTSKLHYLRFASWALARMTEIRPRWCYASDLWSAPIALWAGVPVLYHEHDTPAEAGSLYRRQVLHARARLANKARLCVLPNETRKADFVKQFPRANVAVVMNCPPRHEVVRGDQRAGEFVLYYHGSLVPERLPESVIVALAQLPNTVRLRFAGYETIGSVGHVAQLLTRAHALGVADRVEYLGRLNRWQLLPHVRAAAAGLALVPNAAEDANLRTMPGASNKPFEYLAAGVPLIVSDRPEWRAMFVDQGYALPCNPDDPASIARAVLQLVNAPEERSAMGARGLERVLRDWNYETQFEPVRRLLRSSA